MKVVITGALGFIGRRMVELFSQRGAEILAVDRNEPPVQRVAGVLYHRSDLSDASSLFPSTPWDEFVLIHLAWDIALPWNYTAHAGHVSIFTHLLDYWQDRGIAGLVSIGSAQEFGARSGIISDEDEPVGGMSAYGWGKRAAGLLAKSWAIRTGIPTVWLRPFIAYGPGQTGSMVLPYAVRQIITGEDAEFSSGEQKRDFVYVDDVAEAFYASAARRPEGFTMVNLGCGEPVVVREVLEYLGEQFGASSRLHFGSIPLRAGEPDIQVANTEVAERVLGWRPGVQWREGIRRIRESLEYTG